MTRPRTLLRRLARVAADYGPGAAAAKVELCCALERAPLPSAREVRRLHELLCVLRAYPDDAAVLGCVERLLDRFDRRADLRRHRRELSDSGIAGTAIRFRFFARAARRLAERFPGQLSIDWSSFDGAARLPRLLPLLTLPAEHAAFDDPTIAPRAWLRRFIGKDTDAVFLARAFAAFDAGELAKITLYDELDPPLILAPGRDTPSRTREKYRGALTPSYQTEPLSRARPDLARELRRAPVSVRAAAPREADALIELARDTMLPRERDLEVFAFGNRDDVRLVDAGRGLCFACIGVVPERRSLLEAVYGLLLLKNGVAVGYALCSALYRSSEVAYNVFDTFRGGETAWMFGRLLAAIHHLFGSDVFAIDPYQLGHENDEGLRSGAYWFYQKLGFRPGRAEIGRLMEQELATMRARPGRRSSRATLSKLSSCYSFWPGEHRRDVLGALSVANVALHVSRALGDRFGADRERARRASVAMAAERLGVSPLTIRAWSAPERQAWERWAPLLAVLPGIERWPRAAKRALALVVRAKGGVREHEFVPLFDGHRLLRRAVQQLAETRVI